VVLGRVGLGERREMGKNVQEGAIKEGDWKEQGSGW
jgi:hypothetical protein